MTGAWNAPAELSRDIIMRIESSGSLTPATPAAIKWLTECVGDTAAFEDLPLDREQQSQLFQGDEVMLSIERAWWQLRVDVVEDVRWLCCIDVTDRERSQASRIEVMRARSLASIAGVIAHDLNNYCNAALGIAGQVQEYFQGEDRKMLVGLESSTTAGARMARVLARWLTADVGKREVVDAPSLLDDALAIMRKSFAYCGTALEVVTAGSLPPVRTVPIEAGQAIMHGMMALVAARPANLKITMALQAAAASERNRRRIRLACTATQVQTEQAERLLAVARGGSELLSHIVRVPELEGLASAIFAQRRLGGDLLADQVPDGVRLDYYWPVALSASAR